MRQPDDLAELCRQINAAAPEFVILGGDVTDELTSFNDMVLTYQNLSRIEAPVYFVYGNHDRQPNAAYFGGRGRVEAASAHGGKVRMGIHHAHTGRAVTLRPERYTKINIREDLIWN